MSERNGLPTVRIGDGLEITRIVSGLWQVSGGHGEIVHDRAAEAMARLHSAGYSTFDMADHYGPAEEIAGAFLRGLGRREAAQIATKWCPEPAEMSAAVVEQGVRRSLTRLGSERIDLLQLHWWDYLSFQYIDAVRELDTLRRRGVIRSLGLTNFDAAHLRIVLGLGVPVATNQVHYSLLDRRAGAAMAALCEERGVKLLCYGTLAGGFLSDKWLGRPQPTADELARNWSLAKYTRFIEAFGGWSLFQELLAAVAEIARRHSVSVANVAARWVLDQPAVGAVIVGVRLGLSEHIEDNRRVFALRLDDEDRRRIDDVLARARAVPGDCGDEYRRPPFLTASGDLSHHKTRAWHQALRPPGPDASTPRTVHTTGTTWERQASYSRAVRVGNHIAVSGTTATYKGEVVGRGDPAAQTAFAFDIAEAALESLGGRLADVVRTRLYVPHIERDWRAVAEIHGARMAGIRPANTLVSAPLVGADYLVEVEADAIVS